MREDNNKYPRYVKDKFMIYKYTLQFTDREVVPIS